MRIWKQLEQYPKYEISNDGLLRHIDRKKIRKWTKNGKKKNYLTIKIRNINKEVVKIQASSLVAEAFIGPRPKGKEVNHKDGNTFNNCVENLEYVTHQENIQHSFAILGRRIVNRKWNKEDALKMVEMNKTMNRKQIGKIFGISRVRVNAIIKRWIS